MADPVIPVPPPESRVPFVLGVVGKIKLDGFDEEAVGERPDRGDALLVYRTTWAILDWLRYRPQLDEPVPGQVLSREEQRLRAERLRQLPSGLLDRADGQFYRVAHCSAEELSQESPKAPWRPHGLVETPIIVLSSLAPGVDTLVAEAVLDYAKKFGAPVFVRAPLPLPLDIYQDSSAFCPRDQPKLWAPRRKRLLALVERIREQKGFQPDRDLFPVAVDAELEWPEWEEKCRRADTNCKRDHQERQRLQRADLEDTNAAGEPRRYMRYRAAGEYVATSSQMLLAVCPQADLADEPLQKIAGSLFVANTAAAVRAMREGVSRGLLEGKGAMTWADNGPVLHMRLERGAEPWLSWLHPLDLEPLAQEHKTGRRERVRQHLGLTLEPELPPLQAPGTRKDEDETWQSKGDRIFRRIVEHQEQFNALGFGVEQPAEGQAAEDLEWKALLHLHKLDTTDGKGGALPTWPGETKNKQDIASPEVAQHASGLGLLAAVRRRAAGISSERDAQRNRVLRWLAGLIFLAAVFLGCYEHWPLSHAAAGHHTLLPADFAGWAQVACLLAALACVVYSGVLFHSYLRQRSESLRFDARGIGEGLRVQFYWSLVGLPFSAADAYLQRHRDELSWIRYALLGIALPAERWVQKFEALSQAAKVETLRLARLAWVRGQMHYARQEAARNEATMHFYHTAGWALAGAGLLNVTGKFVVALLPWMHDWLHHHALGITLSGVLLGATVLWSQVWQQEQRGHAEGHSHDPSASQPFLGWALGRPLRWGYGLILGALVFGLSHLKAGILTQVSFGTWPDQHALWIILTGATLLAGALCLAWSERNFFSEKARANHALESLYVSADRRLEALIDRYEAEPTNALLAEIHGLFHELGREALSENAEWLVLHRTRPLEPFMAG